MSFTALISGSRGNEPLAVVIVAVAPGVDPPGLRGIIIINVID